MRFVGLTAAIVTALVGLGMLWTEANASCTCQCVNGEMRPLCSSAMDLPPICPLVICPMAPLSLEPISPLTLPPIGTSHCRQAQVCDRYGNCRWQQVCR